MLTAIIHTRSDEAPLAYTLASLVPGVTEGLITTAKVFGETESRNMRHLVDMSGCDMFGMGEAGFEAALETVTSPWTLLIMAGGELQPGWMSETSRFLASHQAGDQHVGAIACFRVERDSVGPLPGEGWLSRLSGFLGGPSPHQGLICKTGSLRNWWENDGKLKRFPPQAKPLAGKGPAKPIVLNARIQYVGM